jgi:two-component system cell cycle sensor histidine kinase/response regulator CckA
LAEPFLSVNGKTEKGKIEEQVLVKEEKSILSEKYLLAIIDSSLDGIAVVNEKGKFEFANESFFKISGWHKKEIIGQSFMKMIPADAREFVKGHWQAVQMDHGGVHEIKIKTRDEEIKYLNVASSLIEINGENKVIAIVHDISENKKHEIDLKESEEKYKKLFENANDGIYAHDTEGNFTSINKAGLEILGEKEENKVVGSNFYKWLTPESLKMTLDALKKAVSHEITNASLKLEVVRPDNEHRWIEVNAWVIKDGNRVTGINGIARDITEKLKLEEKLKASEALYKDLFENADDPMYTHDLKGKILSVNKVALKLLAVTEEEIIGSNISQWVTPESYKIFEDRVRKIFLNQPLEELVVMEVINKKGEHKWGEARTRLLKDGNKIIGTHGIMRDITEKIKLEKDLKESEEKYRDLFENAQDAMYVLDTEGNFLKMNNVGLQTLRCTKEEVIGTNISRWITPESLKIVKERRKKRFSGEILNKTDILEIVCKNGEHRWVEIKTRGIKDGERIIEIHGIARDITENRLLKQQLKKSNKQQKLLCYLIQGTRGGKTRALILKHLTDRSFNAHQLSKAINMDYKTIRHHLNVLIKNGIIGKRNDGYSDLYFISKNIENDLNDGILQNNS